MGTFEIVSLVTIVYAFAQFLKHVKNGDVNGIVTQLSVWASGIGAAWLFAQSDFAAGITVGGMKLGAINGASLILFGMSVGATATTVYDVKKALDSTDSAKSKPLVGPATPPGYGGE